MLEDREDGDGHRRAEQNLQSLGATLGCRALPIQQEGDAGEEQSERRIGFHRHETREHALQRGDVEPPPRDDRHCRRRDDHGQRA